MIQAQLLSSTRGLEAHTQSEGLISMEEVELKRQSVSTNTWGVIMFIGYLVLGLLFDCYVEGLDPLDSVYLSIITFLTIGYGDIPIRNRVWQSFFVLLGCGIVGIYFSLFTNDVMEQQEELLKNKLVKVAVSMNKFAEQEVGKLREMQRQQHQQFLERVKDIPVEELTPVDRMKLSLSRVFLQEYDASRLSQMKALNLQVYEDELREVRSKMLVDLSFVVVSLLSGAACMTAIEGWQFSDAFYWACVTTMTVGYGDVTPDSTSGKVFTIVYVLFSTALAAKGFRDVVLYPMLVRSKENEAYVLAQFSEELTAKTLRKILHSDLFAQVEQLQYSTAQITKAEFVLLVLQSMNKVHMKDIMLAAKCFDSLDVHKAGALGKQAQQEQMALARQRDRERMEAALRQDMQERLRYGGGGTSTAGLGQSILAAITDTVIPSVAPRSRRPSYTNLRDEDEEGGEAGLRRDSLRPMHSGSPSRRASSRQSVDSPFVEMVPPSQSVPNDPDADEDEV